MERHFSTGVSTIVALMAAHRSVSHQGASMPLTDAIARIRACLGEQDHRAAEGAINRRLPGDQRRALHRHTAG